MADKTDITVPSTSAVIPFANGEGNTVDADTVNANFNALLSEQITTANVIIDQMPQLGVASTYTANQDFQDGIKTDTIKESTTNSDITISTDGTGKVRYNDGNSADTEIATHSYVALTAGNIPSGGTSSTFLRGDAAWVEIRQDLTLASIQASNFSAIDGNRYPCDTTSGGITLTLPASPSAGDRIGILDISGTASANNITIARNGSSIMNLAEDMVVNVNYARFVLEYNTVRGWLII